MPLLDKLSPALQRKRLFNRIKDHRNKPTATAATVNDISNILHNYGYLKTDFGSIESMDTQMLDDFTNVDDIPEKEESIEFNGSIVVTNKVIAKGISSEDISCNDISAVNIYFSGKMYDNDGEFSGGGGGIAIRGGDTVTDISNADINLNDTSPQFTDFSRNEGDIIYDSSQNIFYEASRSKKDKLGGGDLDFRPLGYSFFRENMGGQPPAPEPFFFFFKNNS